MPDFSPGHRNVALEDLQPNTRPGSPHEGRPFSLGSSRPTSTARPWHSTQASLRGQRAFSNVSLGLDSWVNACRPRPVCTATSMDFYTGDRSFPRACACAPRSRSTAGTGLPPGDGRFVLCGEALAELVTVASMSGRTGRSALASAEAQAPETCNKLDEWRSPHRARPDPWFGVHLPGLVSRTDMSGRLLGGHANSRGRRHRERCDRRQRLRTIVETGAAGHGVGSADHPTRSVAATSPAARASASDPYDSGIGRTRGSSGLLAAERGDVELAGRHDRSMPRQLGSACGQTAMTNSRIRS